MIFHKSYPNPHLNSSEVQGTAGDLSLVVYQVDFDPVSSTPSGCQQYQCGSWWEQGSEGRFWIHQSSHAESCLRDERRDPLARSSKFTTQTQTTTGQPIVAPTPDMLEEGGEVCKNLLFAEITVFAFVSRLFEKERLRQNEKKNASIRNSPRRTQASLSRSGCSRVQCRVSSGGLSQTSECHTARSPLPARHGVFLGQTLIYRVVIDR